MFQFLSKRQRDAGRRRGVAAVELAVVLPVLLLVVFGTVAASQLIFFRKSMVAATSEGIRLATQRTVTAAEVQARVNAILASRRITDATVTLTPATIDELAPGALIELSVQATFNGFGMGVLGDGVAIPVTVNSAILRE